MTLRYLLFSYFAYVFRHKWFVFLACCRLGIPWRGLTHDASKFRPSEFLPYARFFHMQEHPDAYPDEMKLHGDVRQAVQLSGRPTKQSVKAAFKRAWLRHQHRNEHHWQHWVLRNDDGATKVLRMSDAQRREMLADWRGAGRALGFPDTAAWYLKNRAHIILHPDTRAWIERELGVAPAVQP